MLVSATDSYRRQQRIVAAGVVDARRARRRNKRVLVELVTAYQITAGRSAITGVDRMLDEQEIDAPPVARVATATIAGTASDGRPLDSLFDQARTDYIFDLMVATQLADVARQAAGVAMASRPGVTGYTRMLNPPSCSRCSVLAGRRYRWNDGFQRHPGCDCIHVPTKYEAAAEMEGLVSDPQAYFDSLSTAEQGRIFTKAGAQAIRDGADISQVVNARRGMNTAQINPGGSWIPRGRQAPVQIGGRDVFVTTESTTIRGLANRRRTGRNMRARLMPESIYANARSHEEAIRLLRLHGYLR